MRELSKHLDAIGIRWKILTTILVAILSALVVGLVAIFLQLSSVGRASALEAIHVAHAIANTGHTEVLRNQGFLQNYVDSLGKLYERDIIIVDSHMKVVADTSLQGIGSHYIHQDVKATLQDGNPRTFIGPDATDPTMVRQVVVPLHDNPSDMRSSIIGAVIFEYTLVYEMLMAQARIASIWTGMLALLVAGFGFWLAGAMTDTIVKPLRRLQAGVAAVAAGDYTVRVHAGAADELGQLGHAFNEMAGELERNRTTLQQNMEKLADANTRLQEQYDKQRRSAEQIEFLAYHDPLTGLQNRAMFSIMLNQALATAGRHERMLAIFFIDLDRFKQINDTLGHDAGDALLKELARRLRATLRASDIVARLGGDEFVVLVPELKDEGHAKRVARKILSTISQPVTLQSQELRVTASVGVSLYPRDGKDEKNLMKFADVAMYQAKEAGKAGFAFYSEASNIYSFERLALESNLRRALENGELQIHYQAKKNFLTNEISGMEALTRWNHPDLGVISPMQFIPVAEETGLIVPIGRWVLRTACAQTMRWHAEGMTHLVVAVNLSPRQFADSRLLQDVREALQAVGMEGRMLELEITESMLMHNPSEARKTLEALKDMGVRIAIDDFGTGYSSLSTLKQLPVDTLKIDRSFIRNLDVDIEDRGLTEAIISMAKTLQLHLVAEGVETNVQAEFLRNQGCDDLQGYYFSRPLPADEFAAFVTSYRQER